MSDANSSKTSLSERTADGIKLVLRGKGGKRSFFLLMGPAIIASIAYMDPGNFATNIQAGSGYGYTLLWVVLMANLIAMLFQSLSAKLGIVTGRNLAEVCRDELPKPLAYVMWVVSEIAAMATDLAEFIGGALGFALLFNMQLMDGMVLTAVITYALLMFDRNGFRPMEIIIGCLVAVIGLCYLVEMLVAPVNWGQVGIHLVTPEIPDQMALFISVGIIGATVMPHALYLHSGLTQNRVKVENDQDRRKLVRYSNREVIIALAVAGMVNMAMVIMAASTFHGTHNDIADIDVAYRTLIPLLGVSAAFVFLISLITSGISSSVVGTMAGQMIMQGFVGFHIPIWLRRFITMVPAFIVVGMGVNPTKALVYSQVVLSLSLPVPMIALLIFTGRQKLMGEFKNSLIIQIIASISALLVLSLNFILLYFTFLEL